MHSTTVKDHVASTLETKLTNFPNMFTGSICMVIWLHVHGLMTVYISAVMACSAKD